MRVDLNELNNYFIESSGNTNESQVTTEDITYLYNQNCDERFTFREQNSESVRKSIMRIMCNSVGPDNFSIKAYKCV